MIIHREIFTSFSTNEGYFLGSINNTTELFSIKLKRYRTTLVKLWTVTELLIKHTASNAVNGTTLQWYITMHQTEILICAILRTINRKSFSLAEFHKNEYSFYLCSSQFNNICLWWIVMTFVWMILQLYK